MRAADFVSVADARRRARRWLPKGIFDYIDGGAGDEVTLASNRQAFDEVTFRPRLAVRAPSRSLRRTVLGVELDMPFLLSPCGMVRSVHPDGEPAVARAARRAGTVSVVSTLSGASLEDAVAAAPGHVWFQLYCLGGRAGAEVLVERAAAAGCQVLMVTVDTSAAGKRERDNHNGMALPLNVDRRTLIKLAPQMAGHPGWLLRTARAGFPLSVGNSVSVGGRPLSLMEAMIATKDYPPDWDDITWIRERWKGALVVKGLLTVEDASRAVDVGADGVVVSNHGGRQLDGAPASLRVLPDIVDKIGSEAEVLVDGGVTRGEHVVKALALGARAVMAGRAYLYGLGAAGEPGVDRVLSLLREDIDRTLNLLGCRSVDDLDRSYVALP